MPIPQQRKPRQTCPICDRKNLAIVDKNVLVGHNPQHADWKWTPHCGGGGLTVADARATRGIIRRLVREAKVLRQIEYGFALARVNVAVGMTADRLRFRRAESTTRAEGVEHSVKLLRGLPASDELDDE